MKLPLWNAESSAASWLVTPRAGTSGAASFVHLSLELLDAGVASGDGGGCPDASGEGDEGVGICV
jgi:hypothetical protein